MENKPGTSPTKIERVLEALIDRPMTRFDAEIIGCHCLNSSVSTLQHKYALSIARRPVKRSGRFGVIHVMSIGLQQESLRRRTGC